jgi:hypothetical protein
MAVKIKSAADIARKWAEVTPARSKVWQDEVRATSDGDWADPTVAAAPVYEAGVTEAIGAGLYAKGVEAKRTKWKRKALAVGPQRYGPGVRAAEGDQAAGFAPYREVIAGLTLSPRGPRGAPGNYDRVREVGEPLNAKRLAGG